MKLSRYLLASLLYTLPTAAFAQCSGIQPAGSVCGNAGVTGKTASPSTSPVAGISLRTPLVIGGATASSTLTLESTSGAGTSDEIIFKTGSQVQRGEVNTSGQWTLGPNFAPQAGVLLTINSTSAAPPPLDVPASLAGVDYVVQIVGKDNTASGIGMYGFGASIESHPGISFHTGGGTSATPSAAFQGQVVGHIGAHPYSTSDWSVIGPGRMRFYAEENFTDSAQGTSVRMETTPVGTIPGTGVVTTAKFLGTSTILGGNDVAAPAAQTITINNVATGTSNTAGANLNFDASKGTGTGVGGDVIWRTAPAGGSGSSQNAFVEAMRLKGTGTLKLGSTANLATSQPGTLLHLVGQDAGSVAMKLDTHNSTSALAGGQIFFRRAKNTLASPAAMTAGFTMGGILGIGYGATDYIANGSTGGVLITAGETWTDTSALTYLQFYTTPTASTTITEQMRLWGSGGLSVGSGQVANDPTSGVVNAATGYRIGNAAASGNVLRGNGTNFVSSALGVSDLSGLGTGVPTALAVDVGSAGAPVVNGGSLGTPSSGVATNLTGTASGLTSGNVTTNANLTGEVTSVGNATTVAAAGRLKTKTVSYTRDLTAASGAVAYTGIGFVPTSCQIWAAQSGVNGASFGISDSALGVVNMVTTTDAASIWSSNNVRIVNYTDAAGANAQDAALPSYDADGFTLTWTKTGSPTGTLSLRVSCSR